MLYAPFQITQLLAEYVLSGKSPLNKVVYITKAEQCYYLPDDDTDKAVLIPELRSQRIEADPGIALHVNYVSSRHTGMFL
jgi:hypothetical protein